MWRDRSKSGGMVTDRGAGRAAAAGLATACAVLLAAACASSPRPEPPLPPPPTKAPSGAPTGAAATGTATVTAAETRALAARYLAIALPANRQLDHAFNGLAASENKDLAAAEADLRSAAATE